MVRPRILLAGMFVAAGFVACDSATEPVDHRAVQRVALERVVTDEVAPDDTSRRFSFVPSETGLHGVFVQGLEGQANFRVVDSATGSVLAFVSLRPRTGSLEEEATAPFQVASGTTCIVHIIALPAGTRVRFQFQVHRINPDPEGRPGNPPFAIGDTIGTESIDDILDFDDFTTNATVGQDIAAAIKATGTPGTEGIILTVFNAEQFLTYTFTSAGEPGGVTGLFQFPASGTYRFRVQGIVGGIGRYTGPYRFWTYFISRAPEHRSSAVTPGAEIAGEDIAPAGDVDEYTFTALAGTEYNVFLQSPRAKLVLLQAFDAAGSYLAVVATVPGDTGLFNHATGRFLPAAAGTVKLRVYGENDHSVSDTGAYRLFIYQVNPLPEHHVAAIAAGDTVSDESIDSPGDVDEFTFSGNAGDEMNLAFQSLSSTDALRADIISPGNQSIANAQTFASDTTLYQSVTGNFTLPATGTYRVRIASPNSRSGDDDGPYRFFLYRVNRQPETLLPTLALGDSLSGEAIDVAGDIDEFTVSVPDSTGALLALELVSPQGFGSLNAELVDALTGVVKGAAATVNAGPRSPSGRLRLGPGTHIVRVSTGYELPTLRGPYRVWLYAFGWGPETASDTFAIGDTVSGESIEPWGDADLFHFFGVRGQHVNLKFQGLDPAGGINSLLASIKQPGDIYGLNASVFTQMSAPSLDSFQSMRLDLPTTGWYELAVAGPSHASAQGIGEQGPYRFALVVEDSLPEHVSASLVPGDSVGAEPIDTPGDWDQFSVTAAPGQELGLITDGKEGGVGPFPYVRARNPANDDSLAATVGQSTRFTGPFTVPPGGQVKIAVYEPASFYRLCFSATCGSIYGFTGPYGLKVVHVNRAPESAPATYVVGDTVRGEAIEAFGDYDEFTATGTAGQPLAVVFRMTAPPVGHYPDYGLTIEIIDPATGDTLAGRGAQTFGQQFWQIGTFNVPAGASFLIRVRGNGTFGQNLVAGPYEFFIKP